MTARGMAADRGVTEAGRLTAMIADHVPNLNNSFVEGSDGSPRIVRNPHVGLGIAIDMVRPDGSRTLVVPSIKGTDKMDFRQFWQAYEDVVRRRA